MKLVSQLVGNQPGKRQVRVPGNLAGMVRYHPRLKWTLLYKITNATSTSVSASLLPMKLVRQQVGQRLVRIPAGKAAQARRRRRIHSTAIKPKMKQVLKRPCRILANWETSSALIMIGSLV